MKLRMVLVGALMSLCALQVGAETPRAWLGTWKLNVAKSNYGSEAPPKSLITKTVPAEGGGYTQTYDGVAADGKTIHVEYTAQPDGKEYPRKVGVDDVIWVKKIDEYNNEWATKKDGKVKAAGRTSYSPDGKVRTQTYTFTNGQGRKVTVTEVYDRQ